jgi:hypothetical protein
MDQELPPWNDGWQKALAVEADQLVACRGQAVTPGDVRLFPAIVAAVRKAAGLGSRQLPWLPGLLLYRPPKGARPVLYLPPTHGGRQSPPEPIAFSAEELERAGVRVLARELGQGSLELRFENTSGTDLRAVAAEGADLTGPLQEGDRPWRRWPAGGRATYRLQGTGEDAHG